jgi:hypothetical protein
MIGSTGGLGTYLVSVALLSLPLAETPTRMAWNTNSLGQTSIKMRSQAEKLGIHMIYMVSKYFEIKIFIYIICLTSWNLMRLYRSKKVRISNKHWGVASKKLCVVNCSQQHCRTVPFHTQCLTQIETVQRIAVRGLWRLMPKKLTSCLKHPKTSWTMLDQGRGYLHAKSARGAAAWYGGTTSKFTVSTPHVRNMCSVRTMNPAWDFWEHSASLAFAHAASDDNAKLFRCNLILILTSLYE